MRYSPLIREDPLKGKRGKNGERRRIGSIIVLGIVVAAVLLRRFWQLIH